MRKFVFLLLLVVGLMACSTAPPPDLSANDTDVQNIGIADNQQLFASITDAALTTTAPIDAGNSMANLFKKAISKKATAQIQKWEVSGKYGDLVISVDDLENSDQNLYASLSVGMQEENVESVEEETAQVMIENLIGFSLDNWMPLLAALLTLAKVVVNLTPSKRDNQVFSWLDKFFNTVIPNNKKGGGTHATPG